MTLWAISCAPLYSGADLTRLDDGDLALMTNREVLAIDQAGRVAEPLSQATPQQVWRAKNADGSWTVALFNLAPEEAEVKVSWSDLGLDGNAEVRDLWAATALGPMGGAFSANVPPHGCRLLNVRAAEKP